MIEQRPITPDQQYLSRFLAAQSNRHECPSFLKKTNAHVLPCQQKNIEKTQQHYREHVKKTKAQIYQEIKEKNRNKFGQWNKKVEPKAEQPKKIHSKNMTVSYQPKKFIDIEEYKQPGYVKKEKKIEKVDDSKHKYQKLIEHFKLEMQKFQQEKSKFEGMADKLQFKQTIKNEEGLNIKSHVENIEERIIKSLIQKSKKLQPNMEKKAQCKNAEVQNIVKQAKEIGIKTYPIQKIQNLIEASKAKIKSVKQKILNAPISQNTQIRYQPKDVHLLPSFDVDSIYQFLNHESLYFFNNSLYQTAINVMHSRLAGVDQLSGEINYVNNACFNIEREDHLKVRQIGQKRVIKYENGWIEVWIPGKQRIMTNAAGYKVVWFSNGDVKQQFEHDIWSYYSKSKDINQISLEKQNPIYFHQGSRQLWQYDNKKGKTVIFKNGLKEYINRP